MRNDIRRNSDNSYFEHYDLSTNSNFLPTRCKFNLKWTKKDEETMLNYWEKRFEEFLYDKKFNFFNEFFTIN